MFQSGQQVICINDEFPAWAVTLYKELPKVGHIYTIRDVRLGQSDPKFKRTEDGRLGATGTEDIAVTLVELLNPPDPFSKYGEELGFKAERFQELEELEDHEHDSIAELVGAGADKEPVAPAPAPGR